MVINAYAADVVDAGENKEGASARQGKDIAPAADMSLADLLREAESLIKAGQPAAAYELLEPREGDFSGEIAYDYMLGIVALDSGKPDRATIAFDRVLAVNPNFPGARLDLARAYFAMGSDEMAKKEFETVLTQSPPDHVKVVVEKHLAVIEERRMAKIHKFTAYLDASTGWDDNATTVTADFTNGVQNTFGIPGVLPTGSSVLSSAISSGISAGGEYTRLIDEEAGLSLFAGADIRQRIFDGLSALNNTNLDVRAGITMTLDADTYRLFGSIGRFRQIGMTTGSNGNRDTSTLSAEWKHTFGERDQTTMSLQYSQPRYQTQPTQDTNQLMISGSWLHIFEGSGTPLIFASVNRSKDQALNSLATGSNMSRTTTGIRAHFQISPFAESDVFVSAGLSDRLDDSPNARSALIPAVYGHDVTADLSAGVNYRPWEKWTLKAQFAAYNNRSNLSLYRYRRTETTISVRRDF